MTKRTSLFLQIFILMGILVPCYAWAQAPDTLRVMSYNILNFPGSTGSQRVPEFRKVIRAMEPDIVVVQEILSQAGVNTFLNDVLETATSDEWEAVPFTDGPDTDNACFFRVGACEFVSTRQISTQLRDISEYVLAVPQVDTTIILRIYSAHLKASQGSDNEQRRLAEVTILRNNLNNLPDGSHFLFVGDFNLYESDEPAYQMLIGEPDNVGRCFDPIDTPGDWHNDADFSTVHTQSPRLRSFGGGSTGGMDDRFDFILGSRTVFDTIGFQYLDSSYTPFGNDGNHFNDSINARPNNAVPDSIADALHYASDHLPVYLDLLVHPATSPVGRNPAINPCFELYANFPNPFNNQTVIEYSIAAPGQIQLQVFDLLGRRVATLADGFRQPGTHVIRFHPGGLASGYYFYSLTTSQGAQVRPMVLIK